MFKTELFLVYGFPSGVKSSLDLNLRVAELSVWDFTELSPGVNIPLKYGTGTKKEESRLTSGLVVNIRYIS